jgi:hypothetical protein
MSRPHVYHGRRVSSRQSRLDCNDGSEQQPPPSHVVGGSHHGMTRASDPVRCAGASPLSPDLSYFRSTSLLRQCSKSLCCESLLRQQQMVLSKLAWAATRRQDGRNKASLRIGRPPPPPRIRPNSSLRHTSALRDVRAITLRTAFGP